MKLILENWRDYLGEDYDLQDHPKKVWIKQDLSTIDGEIMEYLFEQYKTVYSAEGLDLSAYSAKELQSGYEIVMLIDVDKDPMPDAFIFVRGNRLKLAATDGGQLSKSMLVKKLVSMVKSEGYIIEASKKMEDIMKSKGAPPITDKEQIEKMVGPKFVRHLSDGYYERNLKKGGVIVKRLYGSGALSEEGEFQKKMKKQLPAELDFLLRKGPNNKKEGPGIKNPPLPKFKSAPPGTAPVGEAAGDCQVITVLRLGGEGGLANRNAANVEGLQEYIENATDMEGGQFGGGNIADRNVYIYKVEVCGGFGDYKAVSGGARDADTEAETPVGLKEFYGGDFQWFYFPQESEGKAWRVIENIGVIKNFIADPVWELYGNGKIRIDGKPLLDLVQHKPKKNAYTKDERKYVSDEHEELPNVWKHPWEWDAGVIALKHYLDNVYDIDQTGM
jgi:hypothetical protein